MVGADSKPLLPGEEPNANDGMVRPRSLTHHPYNVGALVFSRGLFDLSISTNSAWVSK
jgi:hypothetical protein